MTFRTVEQLQEKILSCFENMRVIKSGLDVRKMIFLDKKEFSCPTDQEIVDQILLLEKEGIIEEVSKRKIPPAENKLLFDLRRCYRKVK